MAIFQPVASVANIIVKKKAGQKGWSSQNSDFVYSGTYICEFPQTVSTAVLSFSLAGVERADPSLDVFATIRAA